MRAHKRGKGHLIDGITKTDGWGRKWARERGVNVIRGTVNTPAYWNSLWSKVGNMDRFDPERLRELTRVSSNVTLDVGCALGHLCSYHYERGCEPVYGVDISRVGLRKAKENYPFCTFVVASAEALPFRDSCFDTYSAAETLEHLPDYKKALSEAERVVKQGGKVIFAVPNRAAHHEHVWSFSLAGVRKLVGASGVAYEYGGNEGHSYILGWYVND